MSMIDLKVDKLVTGGRGLARWDGLAVFIPGAAPGDHLRVRITGTHRNHATAEIITILESGPHRTPPLCPRFGVCGGCQLQHLTMAEQRRLKRDVVVDSLARIGRFDAPPPIPEVAEVSPMWAYRRKAAFKVRVVRDRTLLGFHQTSSHRIVDLEQCPVLRPELNALMQPLRALVNTLSIRDRVPQLDVMVGDTGIGVIVHIIDPLSDRDRDRCLEFARMHHLARLDVQQGRKDRLVSLVQQGVLAYHLEGMTLKFLPVDFIQINAEGNINLVARAMHAAGKGGMAWDLFSGIGNFTLPLAKRYEGVAAVEGNRSSLDRLRLNSRKAGFLHTHTLQADLFSPEGLEALAHLPTPELVLMDPPREGAVALCKHMGQHHPRRLIYVSCDPATFGRDAAILRHLGGQLVAVSPVDLFPHTSHVELVAVFDWQ
ncbi:MAG: 23S rRNA (uracil(1939)-C(5))-methyltransferase RlmD [Magnetococcales bacterium]|nr:23S rRNA (uracil(1939)-C(5))-methyltransferase RlmD [Magnetococcales bacterium]